MSDIMTKTEKSSKNKIIVHPNQEGEIVFDVFAEPGIIPSDLLEDITEIWYASESSWSKEAEIEGLHHIAQIDLMKWVPGRFHHEPRWMTKFDYCIIEKGGFNEREFAPELRKINADLYEHDPRAWKVIDLLMKAGLVMTFSGWDEETRLMLHGVRRVHPKVVLDYEGGYVISPRCSSCGEKTGYCQCYEVMEEAVKEANDEHYCDACYEAVRICKLLEAKAEPKVVKEWRKYRLDEEYNYGLKLKERLHMTSIQFSKLPWKIALVRCSDDFNDWEQEMLEESGCEDDTACECPLGA